MHNNRALEFVREAFCLLEYPSNCSRARIYVQMAIDEIAELLEMVQQCDPAPDKPAWRIEGPARGILVEDACAMIPARLVASQKTRAALPGNGGDV